MSRPLDKREAVSYGQFVNAAYAIFKRDRNALTPEPQPGDLPQSHELVAWLNMTDFGIFRDETKFYGFIARSQANRHEFVLAIRGTEGVMEWWDDAFAPLVPFTQVPQAGRVENGFDRIYSSLKVIRRHGVADGASKAKAAVAPEVMTGSFAEQLERLADSLEEAEVQEKMRVTPAARPRRSFVVTAHSLGSALATLFVMENKWKDKFDISMICTFASPRVGDSDFVRQFNSLPLPLWRIANTQDVVPKVPLHIPWLFDYQHVNTPYEFSSAGKVKWNPGCWHSMSTYLNWLDPTIAVDEKCKP